jgi:uncharacterized LabA/DUF88 family protein
MRNVAVLIEGRNFYAGCKRWAREQSVSYESFRELIRKQTKADNIELTYYMGVDQNERLPVESSARIDTAVDQIRNAGIQVKTFPLKLRTTRCRACGATDDEIMEKQVDAAMAVDAMRLLHTTPTNVFVLVTSDTDQLPLFLALQAAKREVWVVVWKPETLSAAIADTVDSVLLLDEHLGEFMTQAPPQDQKRKPRYTPEDVLEEIGMAEQKFRDGYVGLHYFVTHWKSDRIPDTAEMRSDALKDLFKAGTLIQYKAPDGSLAIKRANP